MPSDEPYNNQLVCVTRSEITIRETTYPLCEISGTCVRRGFADNAGAIPLFMIAVMFGGYGYLVDFLALEILGSLVFVWGILLAVLVKGPFIVSFETTEGKTVDVVSTTSRSVRDEILAALDEALLTRDDQAPTTHVPPPSHAMY